MIKNLLREILLIIITILLLGCSLADSNEKRIEIYTPANDQENLIEVGLNESDSYKLDSKYTHKMISNILYESRDISISLWLKPQANFNWTTILSAGFDQNNFYQLATSGNPDGVNTGLVFSICKDGNIERIMSQSNKKLEVGVYNFVVLTIKDKQTSIYLNGELVGTSITRNIIKDINTKEMIIGKSQFFDDPVFEGKFQELTVYNYALDESSIKEKYNELLPCVVLDSIVFDSYEIFQNDVFLPYI
ncbi:MAG: LamG domain-containing protein, partial [Erysipelotrichaceae bacterium]|nr:LamG domain-containing protein [Erysipelotrichaceae bacterium]